MTVCCIENDMECIQKTVQLSAFLLYWRVIGSLAAFSMLGSFMIILTALLFSRLRKHPYSLVFWLSICDFLFSLKYVFVAIYPHSELLSHNPKFCTITSLYTNFFALASVSWSAAMSINLIESTRRPFGDTEPLGKWYHVFVWLTSILSTVLVGISDDIGISADGTCWFLVQKRFHWQFYVPLGIYFVLALASTIFALIRTWNFSSGATKYATKLLFRMTLYVAVFLASWLGPTVAEIYSSVHGHGNLGNSTSIAFDTGRITLTNIVPSFTSNSPIYNLGTLNPASIDSSAADAVTVNVGLKWWTGVSVSIIGALNSLIWLSNPVIYSLFKEKILRRFCGCFVAATERLKLVGKIQQIMFEDQDQDITRLNIVFRKNALACLLLGIRFSIYSITKTEHSTTYYGTDASGLNSGYSSSEPSKSKFKPTKYTSNATEVTFKDDDYVPLDPSSPSAVINSGWILTKDLPAVAVPTPIASPKTLSRAGSDVFVSFGSEHFAGEDSEAHSGVGEFGYIHRGEAAPPTLHYIADHDGPHLLKPHDFVQTVSRDLSPENLESLDVSDLFTSPFTFEDVSPHVFHNIRLRFGFNSADYYKSLSPGPFLNSVLENQQFSAGRSGSFMCYSPDKKFIIKTIPEHEADTMCILLRAYYNHVESNPRTLLIPILGLYALKLIGAPKLHIIVMANLFSIPTLRPEIVYDLKGSWVDRGGKTTRGVRKDNDLRNTFDLPATEKEELLLQIGRDSAMLRDQGIMDYSLLVGQCPLNIEKLEPTSPPRAKRNRPSKLTSIDLDGDDDDDILMPSAKSLEPAAKYQELSHETSPARIITSPDGSTAYIIGIIDILQAYNLSKKMERLIKVYLRCKNSKGISSINPAAFQERFMKAMTMNMSWGGENNI